MRFLKSIFFLALLASLPACKSNQATSSSPKTILSPPPIAIALGPKDEAPVQRFNESGEFKVLDKKSDGLSVVVYQAEESQ